MARETKADRLARIAAENTLRKALETRARYDKLRALKNLDTTSPEDDIEDRWMWSHRVREFLNEQRALVTELRAVASRANEAVERILAGGTAFYTTPVSADDVNYRYGAWKVTRTSLRENLVHAGYYTRSLGDEMLELAWKVEALQRVRIDDVPLPEGVTVPRYVVRFDGAIVFGETESLPAAVEVATKMVEDLQTHARNTEAERRLLAQTE